jgi:hypothetical protein
MSLRAGAGLHGLQDVCKVGVFGELDWSPGIHEQALGRLHRPGQVDPVVGYFLFSNGGTDPLMGEVLDTKRMQSEPMRDPIARSSRRVVPEDRVRQLAMLVKQKSKEIMKPVPTEDTNFTYKLPGGTSENDLPCERGHRERDAVRPVDVGLRRGRGRPLPLDRGRAVRHGLQTATLKSRSTREASRMRPLPLNVVSDDGDGKLYMVGAAGTQREAILEDGVIDLMVFEVPTPPVALWVQSFAEVAPAMGEPVLDRKRWMVVVDSPAEYDPPDAPTVDRGGAPPLGRRASPRHGAPPPVGRQRRPGGARPP